MDEHQILCGACLEVLPTLAAESVDLVLFSPPYDNLRDFKGFPPIDRVALGSALYRVAKDGAICAVVIQDQTSDGAKSLTSFRWAVEWADRCGWRLFETCIYRREGVPGGWWKSRFRVDHEYIHLFLKGARPRRFDKSRLMVPTDPSYSGRSARTAYRQKDGSVVPTDEFVGAAEKCRGTIWRYVPSMAEGNPTKMEHPATHPDALYADIVRCFTAPRGTRPQPRRWLASREELRPRSPRFLRLLRLWDASAIASQRRCVMFRWCATKRNHAWSSRVNPSFPDAWI